MSISTIQSIPTSEAALESVRAELLAMREEEVDRDARASPMQAAAIADAAAAKLSHHRAEIVLLLGEPAAVRIDRLPVYARAAGQAAVEAEADATSQDLSDLHDATRSKHTLVLTELESAALRGHLDAELIDPARPIQGYAETIKSTKIAVHVARRNWSALEGHTHLTPAMLDETIAAAERLERAMTDRDHGVSRAPAVELRQRALSKLLKEYDEVQRIATYLRWHERDYDAIAPSLFGGRPRRASTNAEEPAPTPTPASPTPNDGGPFSG